jgi:hypothetical protein
MDILAPVNVGLKRTFLAACLHSGKRISEDVTLSSSFPVKQLADLP